MPLRDTNCVEVDKWLFTPHHQPPTLFLTQRAVFSFLFNGLPVVSGFRNVRFLTFADFSKATLRKYQRRPLLNQRQPFIAAWPRSW